MTILQLGLSPVVLEKGHSNYTAGVGTFQGFNIGNMAYSVQVSGGEMSWIVTVLDSCGGSEVACDWDEVSVSLTAGVAYKIAVSSECYENGGEYTLTVTEAVPN